MRNLKNKTRKSILTVLLLTLIVISVISFNGNAAFAQDQAQSDERGASRSAFISHRILVRFSSTVSSSRIRHLVSATGALEARELGKTGVHIIELPAGADEEFFRQAFKAQPDVAFAELDHILAPAEMIPNDPSYSTQWHLPQISAGSAWVTTGGSSSIIIAILDTGVDASHPDLSSKIIPGWNCYDNNSNTDDVTGHGTAVAGTAAAAGNNSLGVASVAWGCQIMPVRISDPAGYASVSTIAAGLSWAADHGARVANVSYACTNFSTIVTAAQYFQGKGGVVAVAAGNDGVYDSTTDNPYVLTASSTTSTDTVASFSNTGNNIDVAAPGVSIFTTLRGGGYGSMSGTSFSAPITAGVAALVLSSNASLNASQVQYIVKHSATDLGVAGWDSGSGWGRLNAATAVDQALSTIGSSDVTAPTVSIVSPGSGASVSGLVIVEAAAADNIGLSSVTISLDGTLVGSFSEGPFLTAWDTLTASNGVHTLSALARDFAGNTTGSSISVNVSNAPGAKAPQISITSPAQNARVSGAVSVYVNATDDLAVTKVELYVDGAMKDSVRSAPFTTKWDTRKAAAGTHTLMCKAYDGSGNATWSSAVTVTK